MKKISFLFKISFCVVMGILLFEACTDSLIIDSDSAETTAELRSDRDGSRDKGGEGTKISNLPSVVGDRYAFDDFDHLTVYYRQLDALYDTDDQAFNRTIAEIERISSVHTKLANDAFVNPEDRYQPFLTDPIMMTIVNEDFEFQVGDVLVTYMNNEELLISSPDDLETQTQIRAMNKGDKLNYDRVPDRAWVGKDDNEVTLRAWCGCDIRIEQISCNEVRVSGSCRNFVFGDGEGTVQIFITNSAAIPPPGSFAIRDERVDGNFEFTIQINNTGGAIFIHALANPDCFAGNTEFVVHEFDPQASCDNNERSTGYLWAQDNGSQGFSHRTSFYRNFWSDYEEAKMWSKWWNGNQWQSNNAPLRVEIDAIRKNDMCQPFEHENEVKTCDCRDKRARVNTGIGPLGDLLTHCDGDVTGTFSKSLSWQGMNWTIDAVGEVDFECCE